ncbi:MAG: hypothetical protein HYY16_14445 [Planctomycetes bacterium]|nr:hypothetical protein [Planctomycetota bacterium]
MSNRFTISRHTDGPEGNHYDLFLQVEDTLKTWRMQRTMFDAVQPAVHLEDHRTQYLDYEGPVSKNRGNVKIWDSGEYSADMWLDDRVIVAVHGKQIHGRLRLERVKPPDKEEDRWTIVDASVAVRKLATTLLRESELDVAPSPPLEELRTILSAEERSLLSFVDAYAKGSDVPWSKVAVDQTAREKLISERARWRHPWLDAAVAHAARLESIAKELLAGRPRP